VVNGVEGVEEEGYCCIDFPKEDSDRLYLSPDKQARVKKPRKDSRICT
jgi:hypothetical protein